MAILEGSNVNETQMKALLIITIVLLLLVILALLGYVRELQLTRELIETMGCRDYWDYVQGLSRLPKFNISG